MSFNLLTGLYIILTLISMLFSVVEYKIDYRARKAIVFSGILILSIMMGIRPLDSPDTIVYYRIFNQNIEISSILKNGFSFGGRYNSIEYMYYVLNNLANILGMSFSVFMGSISFLSTVVIVEGLSCFEQYLNQPDYRIFKKQSVQLNPEIKKDTPIITIWTVYLCLAGYMYSGVAIRSEISMALGILAINIILTRRSVAWYVVSALLILLGTSIQSFGILFVIIIFLIIFAPKIEKKQFIGIWIVFVFMLLIRFGEKFVMFFTNIMVMIRDAFGITAFSSYIYNTEFIVGKWEWYYLVVIGGLAIVTYQNFASNMRVYPLIIVGLGIVAILYPFMAISRVSDYFMLFLVPIFASLSRKHKEMSIDRTVYLGTALLLLPIHLSLIIQSYNA